MGNCLTLEESKRQGARRVLRSLGVYLCARGSSDAEVHRSATISPSKSNASAASLGLNSPDNAPKLSHAESDKFLGSSVNKTGNSANVSLRKLNKSIGNSVHNIGDPTTASLSKSNISNRSIGGISTGSMPVVPKDVKDLRLNPGYTNVDIFTYEEMRLATKNFRPDLILGEGGFGVVYKGVIDDSIRQGYESTKVAIKELNPDGFQGDREWLAEVSYLGQLSHPNLVKLIGYCCEDEHRLLVYEYMACGSLEKHLFRRVCLTLPWSTRMKIAFGAAKGLAFLHGQERSVIYRDFKTANILLDREYNAKLSDFGLAKDGPMGDQTHVSTRVMGTYGYAAPEYVMTGHLTARSDVYGFGVVLLEMLIGRRALDKSRPSREHNLVDWARPLLNHNRRLLKILDPRMDGQYSVRDATKVANLAYTCLSQNPKGRPTMSQVVTILEEFQTPHEEQRGGSSGGETGTVTLYEALDSAPPETESRRRSSRRKEAEKTPNTHSDHHHKSSRGRSRSVPFVENDVYKLSPDYELHRESSVDNPDPNRHHQ